MSNQVTLFQQETGLAVSSKFQPLVAAGAGMDLGEGIRSSYGIVGIKGGRFSVKYKGNSNILSMPHPQDPRQQLPVSFIDVVIIKANGFLNKQYYKGNYVEGSDSPPDCYSLNGKTPSAQVQAPMHTNCALCPMNQFGSKIGDDGKKQKACRDTKKLAIAPLADIKNSAMGGAMLFRVPPSALKDLSVMSDALKGRGYPYNSVAVRVGFDTTVSHPKPTFQALRPLNDAEADLVLEMFASDSVESVLGDNDVAPADEAIPPSAQFLQPTPVAAPQAARPVSSAPLAAAIAAGYPATPQNPAPVGAVAITPFTPNAVPPVPTQFTAPVQSSPRTLVLAPEQAEEPVQVSQPQVAEQVPAAPAANPFAAPPGVQQAAAPVAAPKTRRAPVQPVTAPAPAAEQVPPATQMDQEVENLLAGLGEFMGGK